MPPLHPDPPGCPRIVPQPISLPTSLPIPPIPSPTPPPLPLIILPPPILPRPCMFLTPPPLYQRLSRTPRRHTRVRITVENGIASDQVLREAEGVPPRSVTRRCGAFVGGAIVR